jgi:hypothetical protein
MEMSRVERIIVSTNAKIKSKIATVIIVRFEIDFFASFPSCL